MSLGTSQRTSQRTAATAAAGVPPATRAARTGWRDPRLWIGVLIVAVSVVTGARLLAAADDTVPVWAVATDAGPGARLTPDQLVVHRVRFADTDDLRGYFTADDALPSQLLLVRGVTAGELLPRAALGSADDAAGTVELPVAVEAEQVPRSVHAGSVVDVYLLDRRARGDGTGPALRAATVVDAPSIDSTFGSTTGRRQLVLAVAETDATAFLADLGRAENPVLTVVRKG